MFLGCDTSFYVSEGVCDLFCIWHHIRHQWHYTHSDTHSSKSTHERGLCVSLLKSLALLHACLNLHVACMSACMCICKSTYKLLASSIVLVT